MKPHALRDTNQGVPRGKGKDVAVNRFLQEKILEWEAAKRPLKHLAELAGVSPSLITQVKVRGDGAGVDSAPKLAEALGYSYPVLWQLAHGVPLCRTHPEWERMAADAERAGVPRAYIDKIGDTIPPMGFGLEDLTSSVLTDLGRALASVESAKKPPESPAPPARRSSA